jgi:hypothetical protein
MASKHEISRPFLLILATALLGSLAVCGFGIAKSNIFKNLWPMPLACHTAVLIIVSLCIAALGIFLLREGNKRGVQALILLLFFVLAAAFGAAGFFGALLVLACCFLAGHAVLALTESAQLPIVSTFVVGLGAVILVLVGISILHAPMPPVFWALLTMNFGALVFFPAFRRRVIESLNGIAAWDLPAPPAWSELVPLAMMIFALLFYAAQAALPERYWDAMVTHLMVPTQIVTQGHWNFDFVHYVFFAFFPMGVDYVYAFAFAMGSEMAARLFNLFILAAIVAQIYGLANELGGARIARLVTVLFLSIPVTLIVTASLFVENTLALLAITCVRLLMLQNSAKTRAALVGLAVLLGALVAVKLHGFFIAAPVILIALFSQEYRRLGKNDWRAILPVAVLSAALGLLIYVYAWWATGNPVFPLENAFFHSPYWAFENFSDSRWPGKLASNLLYQMSFNSSSYLEAANGAIGITFMALLAPGLLACAIHRTRLMTIAMIVAVVYSAGILSQIQYLRYLYPVFPLFVLICAAGLERLASKHALQRAISVMAIMLAFFGFYKLPAGGWILREDLAAVYNADARRQMILGDAPERLANEKLNSIASNPRVIYGTNPYGALLRGTPIYTNWYDATLNKTLIEAKGLQDVKTALDAEKADFVIADRDSKNDVDTKVLRYAQTNGEPIADIGRLTVFRLKAQ